MWSEGIGEKKIYIVTDLMIPVDRTLEFGMLYVLKLVYV